jgi:hypothetical protein
MPCGKLEWIIGSQEKTLSLFPGCESYYNGSDINQATAVKADLSGEKYEAAAVLDISFGMAFWMALFIHAVAVEIYVSTKHILMQMLIHKVEFHKR